MVKMKWWASLFLPCFVTSFQLAPSSVSINGRPSDVVTSAYFAQKQGKRSHMVVQRSRSLTGGSFTCWASPPIVVDNVLSSEDLIVGTFLAFGIAFTFSFLRRSSRSQGDFVLWAKQDEQENEIVLDDIDQMKEFNITNETNPELNGTVVFDAESWKEMSRPENYVLFNKKNEKERLDGAMEGEVKSFRLENPWVLLALLVLFVPIFSIELFFALSRQVICGGDPFTQADLAVALCSSRFDSPYFNQ